MFRPFARTAARYPLLRRLVATSLAAWCVSRASAVQAEEPVAPRRPSPVAFVVSGGVSLGAYEAGFLYAIVEALKRHRDVFDIRVATGASAGSTNGFLSLLASCEPPVPDPTQSLLFSAWKEVGFPRLFDPKDTTPIAAFSRKPLDRLAEKIQARFMAGVPTSCDVMLGVSTTRLASQKHVLGPDSPLQLPRTEEKFVVRMLGKGNGKPPSLENYVDPRYGFPQALLPSPRAHAPSKG